MDNDLTITIFPVENGFLVSKGFATYIAYTESEIISLVKKLIKPEELQDPPF